MPQEQTDNPFQLYRVTVMWLADRSSSRDTCHHVGYYAV
jgi:hypothetical protein